MPNHKTEGVIRVNGAGRPGLTVKVFERDTVFGLTHPWSDKELGSAVTGDGGSYAVEYEPGSYGGGLDEDTVETKPGSLFPLQPPEYGPSNPDIFIKVYDENSEERGSSEVSQDVGDDVLRIDLDVDLGQPAPRNPFESFVDEVFVIVEPGINFLGSLGLPTGLFYVIRDLWDATTDREEPMPDDLWEAMALRYSTFKRSVLIRHFLPPQSSEFDPLVRYIPYLVSGQALLGFRDPSKTWSRACDPLWVRYESATTTADFDAGRTYQWRPSGMSWEDYYQFLPTYSRVAYENGLAYTGCLISALAYEHATLPDGDAAGRKDCADIIALALDALEDLELRGGLSGYIIRYHEWGESVGGGGRDPRGVEHPETPCAFGSPPDYCLPVGGQYAAEGSEEWRREGRRRRHEPSKDEYAHLIEGLVTAYNLLTGAEPRARIRGLLARLHRYFHEHAYFLVRPCAHFTHRGPYMPDMQYPWGRLLHEILGVEPRDEAGGSFDSSDVCRKAGYEMEDKTVSLPGGELRLAKVPKDVHIDHEEADALNLMLLSLGQDAARML